MGLRVRFVGYGGGVVPPGKRTWLRRPGNVALLAWTVASVVVAVAAVAWALG